MSNPALAPQIRFLAAEVDEPADLYWPLQYHRWRLNVCIPALFALLKTIESRPYHCVSTVKPLVKFYINADYTWVKYIAW